MTKVINYILLIILLYIHLINSHHRVEDHVEKDVHLEKKR